MQQPPDQPGAPQGQPGPAGHQQPCPQQPYPQQPYGGPAPGPVMYSPDGRWWWDGRGWQPVPIAYAPSGGGSSPIVAVVVTIGVLLLIAVFTIVILTVVGKQVNNVFSNISSGLGP